MDKTEARRILDLVIKCRDTARELETAENEALPIEQLEPLERADHAALEKVWAALKQNITR